MKPIPSRFIFEWKYDNERNTVRQKSRIIVHRFHEVDTGSGKTAPVAHWVSVRLVIAQAAKDNLSLHQMDVETAFLSARMGPEDLDVYVVPPEGSE